MQVLNTVYNYDLKELVAVNGSCSEWSRPCVHIFFKITLATPGPGELCRCGREFWYRGQECTSKPSNWSDQWGTRGTYKTKNWCTKAGEVQYSLDCTDDD